LAHKKIKTLLRCANTKECAITKTMKRDTDKYMRNLDLSSDEFVDRISSLFLERTFELEDFRTFRKAN